MLFSWKLLFSYWFLLASSRNNEVQGLLFVLQTRYPFLTNCGNGGHGAALGVPQCLLPSAGQDCLGCACGLCSVWQIFYSKFFCFWTLPNVFWSLYKNMLQKFEAKLYTLFTSLTWVIFEKLYASGSFLNKFSRSC